VLEPRLRWRVIDAPVAEWPATALVPGQVALWWLGQAGFLLRSARRAVMIDPYLSDSLALKYRGRELAHVRCMPPPLIPAAARGLDALLCTHAHSDHMDPGTLPIVAHTSPRCRFVVPRAVQATALSRGVPPGGLVGINDGEAIDLADDLRVEAIAAAHEELGIDVHGEHRFLGYVITLAGITFYHSGDCVPYPGLDERLDGKRIDVALLPVNGRDHYRRSRGVPGNFRLDEAVRLAEDHKVPLLVPHHFGLFDFNTVDRATVDAQAARSGRTRLLVPDVDRAIVVDVSVS
jgi:L-ascorbate metabolism protein UlaG (beta-lactamase superfamily)